MTEIGYTGPKSPRSPGWWVFIVWLSVAGTLALFGFAGGYVIPSPDGDMLAFLAALVAAAGFGLFAAKDRSFRPDNSYYKALSVRYAFAADPKLRIPVFALFGFVLTFWGVERSGIALWTAAAGTLDQRTVTVASYYRARRGGFCTGFYLREAPFTLAPPICTHRYEDSNTTAPTAGAKLRIVGKETRFGILPESVEALSVSDHP